MNGRSATATAISRAEFDLDFEHKRRRIFNLWHREVGYIKPFFTML